MARLLCQDFGSFRADDPKRVARCEKQTRSPKNVLNGRCLSCPRFYGPFAYGRLRNGSDCRRTDEIRVAKVEIRRTDSRREKEGNSPSGRGTTCGRTATLERTDHTSSRCSFRPLPTSRVCRGFVASVFGRRNGRIQRPGGILSQDLHHGRSANSLEECHPPPGG